MKSLFQSEHIDLKTLYLLFTGNEIFSDFSEKTISGLYIANEKGNTLWVSSGCEQLWGYTPSELLGKNVVDLEKKGVWKPSGIRKVLEASRRVTLLQETGVGRQLYIVGNPIFDSNGKLCRVINGVLDVNGFETPSKEHTEFFFQCGAMQEVYRLLKKVAPLDITVLIVGESGTGKEIAARSLHRMSTPEQPFVKIDCGAIAGNLLESELFGYEPGAFSGAGRQGKKALVETARGGTLFLDEIGEIPLSLQSKFLRLIQDKTYLKVGGTKEYSIDARIIAATHRNLEKMVEDKEFRQYLYFRLNVVPITLPPLSERKSDIPALVEYLCLRCERHFGYAKRFSAQALACLCRYPWPGNIRELENIVKRMMVIAEHPLVDVGDLPNSISGAPFQKNLEISELMPLKDSLRLTEDQLLLLAWKKSGTTTGVAKILGINQSTASRKLRKLLESMR